MEKEQKTAPVQKEKRLYVYRSIAQIFEIVVFANKPQQLLCY